MVTYSHMVEKLNVAECEMPLILVREITTILRPHINHQKGVFYRFKRKDTSSLLTRLPITTLYTQYISYIFIYLIKLQSRFNALSIYVHESHAWIVILISEERRVLHFEKKVMLLL